MGVVAAYLLVVLGGNNSPSVEDIKNILGSVGAEADEGLIGLLLSHLKGRDLAKLIACGREKLASSVPWGGVAPVAATPSLLLHRKRNKKMRRTTRNKYLTRRRCVSASLIEGTITVIQVIS